MIWLLLACKPDPSPLDSPLVESHAPDSPVDSPTDSPVDSALARPAFVNPPEAPDLDPAEGSVRFEITAGTMTQIIEDTLTGESVVVEGFAYNGTTPGPTLRARLGDRVTIEFTNNLDDDTTIHWHGLAVPYEMDGVTWTNGGVPPGGTFTYSFTVEQAGTFWYHPHFNSDRQVDNGLYGMFIVEDPADPPVDREVIVVVDDWESPDDVAPPHGGVSDSHGADGEEGLWTVNHLVQPVLTLRGGERVRLRALNTSNSGFVDLAYPGMRQIAGDQGLLPALAEPESLLLPPGDRFELELLPGEEDFEVQDLAYSHSGGAGWDDPGTLFTVQVEEPAPAAQPAAWPFSGAPASLPASQPDVVWVLTGDLGGPWLINGEQFPDITVPHLALGESMVIEVRNLSPSDHPFHTHGMEMEVLSLDGVAPAMAQIEDTINLRPRQVLVARITPRYAGSWMMHCHILEHAEGGMMTVLTVDEP